MEHSVVGAISAHRRDTGDPAVLEAAVTSGAEYAELDIRRTADGELVVHHDERVAGTPLARSTYRQLCAAAGHQVPRVREALQVLAGRVKGHLDLKEPGTEHEVVSLALDVLGPHNFVVTTDDTASITAVKRTFPRVIAALTVGRHLPQPGTVRDLFPVDRVRACGADWVAMHHRLARLGVLSRCAREGIPAMVWTVNDQPLMRRFLADDRVSVLITDRPGDAVRLRADTRTRGPFR
ncbi:glycerophosphodiester phosphodiesterase [Actinomadura scrupuli]|uniref:glycerophosphodiester phosphodiesterase n=1 Tax=Actinomadura scrupuli TaxID=559629 RepID=UPI003D9666E5